MYIYIHIYIYIILKSQLAARLIIENNDTGDR